MNTRNEDGSISMEYVEMTKVTYQYIHDAAMSEVDPYTFMPVLVAINEPEEREKLYRKSIFEVFLEESCSLDEWVYHGNEADACDTITIENCTIPKDLFEIMEADVCSYTDESVFETSCEGVAEEQKRDSIYLSDIVEEWLREQALSRDLNSLNDDDLFETVHSRYFY
ncbi:MAG: hypothetical protein PUD04_09500 [Firmicutes bacterium]|nr:hypothetical protein [Bacillota bacterium]